MTALPTSHDHRIPLQGGHAGAMGDPRALWTRVEQSRGSMAESRAQLVATQYARSRWDYLEALQAYTDCLTAHHRPVPYRLRDELRLLRSTCAADTVY